MSGGLQIPGTGEVQNKETVQDPRVGKFPLSVVKSGCWAGVVMTTFHQTISYRDSNAYFFFFPLRPRNFDTAESAVHKDFLTGGWEPVSCTRVQPNPIIVVEWPPPDPRVESHPFCDHHGRLDGRRYWLQVKSSCTERCLTIKENCRYQLGKRQRRRRGRSAFSIINPTRRYNSSSSSERP